MKTIEAAVYRFNADKAVQLAAMFLRRTPNRVMDHAKLVKLMYLADRESILTTGLPITGDLFHALPNGPVLSYILNCVYGEVEDAGWDRHFSRHGRHEIIMNEDPGGSLLSRRDEQIADSLYDHFEGYDVDDMIRYARELPEWRKNNPGRSALPIAVEDILEAGGKTEAEIALMVDYINETHEIGGLTDELKKLEKSHA